MTNAIINTGTVQTPINGIGTDLRCVAVVGRDVRARHQSKRDLRRLTGKRLHPAHASFTTRERIESSMSSRSWQRPALPQQPARAAAMSAAAADMYLPPAAWASLVVLRATSA